MRCKKHLTDHSSVVGVCASCLRERLFALIAAQAQAQQAHAQAQQQAQLSRALSRAAAADQDPRKPDPNPLPPPPPLAFPRSVSPYVSRRKSDGFAAATTWSNFPPEDHHRRNNRHLRFYSTPQVGPTFGGHSIDSGSYKKKKSRFSFLSNLFRSRSEKFESDPRAPYRDTYPASSSSSPSWFSAIFPSRRDKSSSSSVQSQFFAEDSSVGGGGVPRHRTRTTDRGMSPARDPDFDYDYDECAGDRSPSVSGFSSESSPRWKKTPTVAPPSTRRLKPGQSRNVSGLAFCLSPLVRASPNRHWNQKGIQPEIGKSGEARVPGKPQLANAASFCKNRSRKLADFGRANNNR